MTTPTREQVVRWMELSNATPRLYVYMPVLESIAALARADLEATIAEQAAEIERYRGKMIANAERSSAYEADNIELRQQLAAQQAYAEQLREALADMRSGWKYIRETYGDLYGVGWDRAQCKADDALVLPSDHTALREHDAKLVEKLATMTLSTYALKTVAAMIREGTFIPE